MAVDVRRLSEDGFTESPYDTGSGGTVTYLAKGSVDELTVRAAVNANAPALHLGFWLLRVKYSHKGGGVWIADAEYGIPPTVPGSEANTEGGGNGAGGTTPPTPGDDDQLGPEWSISTVGGTEKVQYGKHVAQTSAVGIDQDSIRFGAAIGQKDSDSQPEGTEVAKPVLEFSTTRSVRITPKYLRTVYDLTGTVNASTFLGYPAGDVLFLGIEAQFKDPAKGWQATYKFAVSPTLVGEQILGEASDPEDPDQIVPFSRQVTKSGWDYLWYGFRANPASKGKTQKPIVAVIHRVYQRRNFALLGIGG